MVNYTILAHGSLLLICLVLLQVKGRANQSDLIADVIKGSSCTVCNDRCGCPSPCPGAIACRCTSASRADDVDSDVEHSKCSCGEHCGCNPCTCSRSTEIPTTAAGKAFSIGRAGCTCLRCAGA